MKTMQIKTAGYSLAGILSITSMLALPVSAVSAKASTSASTTTTAAGAQAVNQAHLQRIITRGNSEIDRRLATLSTLSTKINSATKLSASSAATLRNTVSSDTSALTALRIKLDGETTVAPAITDAQSIILDYRVYVLVVPQVDLVKSADDQQTSETQLTALATKLQSRITAAQQSGKDVTSMQASLADLNSKVAAAQSISSSVETKVIGLLPSDYNTDHTVLSGDRNQLETVQTDIKAAISDSSSIISQLPKS